MSVLPASASWPHCRYDQVPAPKEAARLVAAVRASVGAGSGYISLMRVCEAGGFRPRALSFGDVMPVGSVKGQDGDRELQALLVPGPRGFDVYVNADAPSKGASAEVVRRRSRFRLAHEIGHSFFYDRRQFVPERVSPGTVGEERFCDLFASLLLVPEDALPLNLSPEAIRVISDRLDVSMEVVARAAADSAAGRRGAAPRTEAGGLCVHDDGAPLRRRGQGSLAGRRAGRWPLTVLALAWRSKENGEDPGWRVDWAAGAFCPRNKRFTAEVVRAAEARGYAASSEHIEFGHMAGCYRFEALRSQNGERMLVVATLLSVVSGGL